jgi:hypothetical protein
LLVDKNARLSGLAAFLALASHAVNGLAVLLMSVFPTNLDELQHLSFVRTMAVSPRIFPDYERMRVLDAHGHAFTATPNYLSHPSPYYVAMAGADRLTGGDITALRFVNLGLSLAAVALLLVAGFRVLKGWPERAVYAAALVLFPKIGVVAGMINNDNAAWLAVAVAVCGLVAWQRRPSTGAAALLAVGLALCGWTKLTALLMVGFGFAIAEALRWAGRAERPALRPLAVVAGGLALGAAPTLVYLATSGRFTYHPAAWYVPPDHRVAMTFGRYVGVFLGDMVDKWSALEPADVVQALGFYLVLSLSAAAVALGLGRRFTARDDDDGAAWRVACGLMLATAPVLLTHLYFGWRTFLEDGYLEMAQTRYYYGVWPGFALGLALLWGAAPRGLGRALTTALTVILLASASVSFAALTLLAHGRAHIG